jgi:hypothetical protein
VDDTVRLPATPYGRAEWRSGRQITARLRADELPQRAILVRPTRRPSGQRAGGSFVERLRWIRRRWLLRRYDQRAAWIREARSCPTVEALIRAPHER